MENERIRKITLILLEDRRNNPKVDSDPTKAKMALSARIGISIQELDEFSKVTGDENLQGIKLN